MTNQQQDPGSRTSNQKSTTAGSMNDPNRSQGREDGNRTDKSGAQGGFAGGSRGQSGSGTDDEANRAQGADWQGHGGAEKRDAERERQGTPNRSGQTQPR